MPVPYRNRASIRTTNPHIAEALDDFASHIDLVMRQTNSTLQGEAAAPPDINSIQVTAAQGIFDIAITDNSSAVARGINYFVEYSTSPSFSNPYVIDLGAARNYRTNLGNQTLYFRGYSQYPTSPRSNPVAYGGAAAPTAVVGGGTSTGPAPLPSNGSGTSSGSSGGNGGFGNQGQRSQPAGNQSNHPLGL